MKRFDQYIDDVLAGNIITCDYIKLAAKRHISDIGKSEYYFDRDEAQRIINFIEICRHWKGEKAGEQIVLEGWQCFYLGSIFGWKQKNGLRRFKETYLEVGRKNSKTTMLGLISLYHMLFEPETGKQVYCAAVKEEQARILVNDAGRIVEQDKYLSEHFKLFKHRGIINRVVHHGSSSFIGALGGDSKTQDGLDPSMGNIDEYHEHKTDALLNVIESGMAARQQPLINIITTAGFHKEYPCYSVKRKTAIDVLKGIKQDDSLFALIYTLDDGDNWEDQKNWIKSNPNYGVSVRKEYLDTRFIKAKNEGGSKEVEFKTKNLNIWTNASTTWIKDEIWLKNTHGIKKDELLGKFCYGGLDLSKTNDFTAYVFVFPDIKGKIALLPFMWIPESRVKYYVNWMQSGYIEVCSGNVIDNEQVALKIQEESKKYKLKAHGYDYWGMDSEMLRRLEDIADAYEVRQGYKTQTKAVKLFDEYAKNAKFENFENPVLRWMLSNVVLDQDPAGNRKLNKAKSQDKIDGIAATCNALYVMDSFEDNKKSIYEDKPLIIL